MNDCIKRLASLGFSALAALACAAALAQQPTLDPTFNLALATPGGVAQAILIQPDGKIIVAGNFGAVDGTPRSDVARLHPDGTLDTTFDPGLDFTAAAPWSFGAGPLALALQTDGKVLVGGRLDRGDAMSGDTLVRFNTDGSVDLRFDLGLGIEDAIHAISVERDNKIVIAGRFQTVRGTARSGIARLLQDGNLDTTFDPGTEVSGGFDWAVTDLAIQADGKMILAGNFTKGNGTSRQALARINTDGSLDTTLTVGLGVPTGEIVASISSVINQDDSALILGGDFSSVNGVPRPGLARLHADGSLDETFNPALGKNSSVRTVLVQNDGRVLIIGSLRRLSEDSSSAVARLNSDGSLDTTFPWGWFFDSQTDIAPFAYASALQGDGKMVVVGFFSAVRGSTPTDMTPAYSIVRFRSDGRTDETFNPVIGSLGGVNVAARQAGGKIVLAGTFIQVNGVARTSLVRVDADGSVDSSFDALLGEWNSGFGVIRPRVSALVTQTDDKLLIAGGFPRVNGVDRTSLARLNPDGRLDADFNPRLEFSDPPIVGFPFARVVDISALALQQDGRLLVGGDFARANGVTRRGLARFNSDGSLDTSFDPGSALDSFLPRFIYIISLQTDGRVLIGGYFSRTNSVDYSGIARLNADGSLDTAFNPGSGIGGLDFRSVAALILQPDGKVLLAGNFRKGIARLNSDGSVDTAFDPGLGVTKTLLGNTGGGTVSSLALRDDGKILIAGDFTGFDGVPRMGIAQLNAGGRLDPDFDLNLEFAEISEIPWRAEVLDLQDDGNLLIGGSFLRVLGQQRPSLARVYLKPGRVRPVFRGLAISADGFFVMQVVGEADREYEVESSSDLINWTRFGRTNSQTGQLELRDRGAREAPRRFYRAQGVQP